MLPILHYVEGMLTFSPIIQDNRRLLSRLLMSFDSQYGNQ